MSYKYVPKIVLKIFRRSFEEKIEHVHEEDQFGFRTGKGARDAIGMLRIISERTLEIDEELCLLHRREEDVSPNQLDQINADPTGNW
jgi:hypothetical protein